MPNDPRIPTKEFLESIGLQHKERYLPSSIDESHTILEKLNRMGYNVNKNNELSEQLIKNWNDFSKWVDTEFDDDVKEKIANELTDDKIIELTNPTVNNLINTKLLDVNNTLTSFTRELADTPNMIKPNYSIWQEFEYRGINVKWLGAKGDGVSDDTVAIQLALYIGGPIYFPSGTYIVNRRDSTPLNILELSRDTELIGTGNSVIKVGNKANQYYSIIHGYVADLKFGIRGMKFDANGVKNPQVPRNDEDRYTALPYWRHTGLWLEIGNLYLYDTEFIDIYGTQAVMYGTNPNNYKNSFAYVEKCKFLDIGGEYGQSIHDHSTLYVHKYAGAPKEKTLHIIVKDNFFKAKSGFAPNATNAFEFGGEVCVFSGNTVEDYRNGCAYPPLTNNVKAYCFNNTFDNVGTGVTIWSNKLGGYVAPFDWTQYRFDELVIRDNNMTINPGKFKDVQSNASLEMNEDGVYPDYYAGVRFFPSFEQKIKTIDIRDNHIEFVYDSTMPASGYLSGTGNGIDIVAHYGEITNSKIDDLTIKGNTFKNIPLNPIKISIEGVKNLIVDDNTYDNVCLLNRGQVIFLSQNSEDFNVRTQITDNDVISGNYSMYYYIWGGNNTSSNKKYGTLLIEGNKLRPSVGLIDQYIYLLAKYNDIVVDDIVIETIKSVYLGLRYDVSGTRMSYNLKFSDGVELKNNLLQLRRNGIPSSNEGIQYFSGDIIWNTNPTPGSYIGWICVSNGDPGTWKGFGVIQI